MEISVELLRAARDAALRKRVWYRALDGLERGIVNLTIDQVERVKSLRLAGAIADIPEKRENALKSDLTRHLEAYCYGKRARNMYNPVGWRHSA